MVDPPKTLAKALAWGGRDVRGEVWFGSFFRRLVVFLMISPKLHAIRPVLFLILPQDLIVVLLMYFATLGDG